MSTVSAYEAKTHLSALLERAAAGEPVTITKHGHPIARLTSIDHRPDIAEVIAEMRAFRASLGNDPIDVRALVEDGRRY